MSFVNYYYNEGIPDSEITRIKLYAKVFPIFVAVGLPSLEQLDPFTVTFMFVRLCDRTRFFLAQSGALTQNAALFMLDVQ